VLQSSLKALGRTIAGVFAGFVLGGFVQEFFFSDIPFERTFESPVLIGATALFGGIALVFGGRELSSRSRRVVVSVLSGIVFGVLIGKFAIAPTMTMIQHGADSVFLPKFMAFNEILGIAFGALLGGLGGLLAGLLSFPTLKRGLSQKARTLTRTMSANDRSPS